MGLEELMDRPAMEKAGLWFDGDKGLKGALQDEAKPPVLDRDDIPDVLSSNAYDRGDRLQRIRLRRCPSIDVEHERVYAGTFDGSKSELEDRLLRIGARTNPTAYVEITEENGPDDGSYSILYLTESGGGTNTPRVITSPSFFRRVKDQIHIIIWETEGGIDIGAHRERHAWLQPARHVIVNDSNAEVGVRDFRDRWYDKFGEELGGKSDVKWPTTH